MGGFGDVMSGLGAASSLFGGGGGGGGGGQAMPGSPPAAINQALMSDIANRAVFAPSPTPLMTAGGKHEFPIDLVYGNLLRQLRNRDNASTT